jgi:hypothetical protein
MCNWIRIYTFRWKYHQDLSGSIPDPEYQYATLKFTVDDFVTILVYIYLSLMDEWWSVQC